MRSARTRERRWRVVLWVASLWLAMFPTAAMGQQVVFDETVATVNDELITKSDLLWNLALDPNVRVAEFWDPKAQTLALESLVDQRLLLQDAAKLPTTRVSREEVATFIADLERRFASPDDSYRLAQRMELVGLTRARLERIVRDRLRIERYVDFRFRSFVVVSTEDVVQRFNEEFKPKLPAEQQTPAALERELAANRKQIETLLTEEKITTALDAYLAEARRRADIVPLNAQAATQ